MAEGEALGKRKLPKVLKTDGAELGTQNKWWENQGGDDEEGNSKEHWKYLEHHGVQFPAEYVPKGLSIKFEGTEVPLTPIQEELAFYWCQCKDTEWEHKPEFRANFSSIFASSLGHRKYRDLSKLNFSSVIDLVNERKEQRKLELAERKNWSTEKKMQLKKEKELKDATYGYALLDGIKEKVGGYTIEPPTLFRGRGQHPKSGYFKPRTYPEDVTLNLAESAPVPKCHLPGRSWKDVVHNPQVTWLAFYKDEAINNSFKYFFLSANSKLKGLNDMKKYEKARKLRSKIDEVRKDYVKKINSNEEIERQLGTVTYFIDKLALRVGNEKNSEEEADTVGCCSLRVEHITLLENNQVKFDFLGKDSMRYENTVTVDSNVWRNLQGFMKKKKPSDDLFDMVNPSKLNDYLNSLMDKLTAKVFRTYNASSTLDQQLNNAHLEESQTVEEKYKAYTEANKQVAILCNHQKTVNKDFDEKLEKFKHKVDDMEDYMKELQTHLGLIKKGKKGIQQKESEKEGAIKRRFPVTVESTNDAIARLSKKINEEKLKLDEKIQTKNVALGTSKINYNDPRISVAWCKRNNVPIEKVFSKDLRGKFTWAMNTEPSWQF